jgi:hypothetical protein
MENGTLARGDCHRSPLIAFFVQKSAGRGMAIASRVRAVEMIQ